MGYSPNLISNNKTGLDQSRQPWLIPDDAQAELLDGFVYRGVMEKRTGYSYLATGIAAGNPYCESRMVSHESGVAMNGLIDDANKTYTVTIGASNRPIRRGTFVVTGSNPLQVATDDGVGGFTGPVSAGSIDYNTGAVSVTFNTAPIAASTVTAAFDFHPGLPVMMVADFISGNDTHQLIVCDTKNVNKYNTATDRLEDITNREYTGNNTQFFSWVNYPNPNNEQRLLFVNNKDPIQQYLGGTVYDFQAVISANSVAGEAYGNGTGGAGPYLHTAATTPVVAGTVKITEAVSGQEVTDNGFGVLQGDGTGTVNYNTGAMSVTFNAVIGAGNPILVAYDFIVDNVQTCLLMFDFKDRLICLRTTEGGAVFPQRIRISGTGAQGDSFDVTATGAGVIDIPDGSFIMGATQNRDDLIIFMERSIWIMRYTGSDIVPFTLDRLDSTRGSGAPFAPITYLNTSNAYSQFGFIATDGYSVQRTDDKIPRYSFDSIDQDNFILCYSGEIVEDRDHYLIHPSPGQTKSDRILVSNYEEFNFQVYRIPLSCMGSFYESYDITWNSLIAPKYNSWDNFSAEYASWNEIGFSKNSPISVGGGHYGEVWDFSTNQSEDNFQLIRNVTVISSSPPLIQVTTDWNNFAEGDYIYLDSMSGMVELNNKQGFIPEGGITDNYTFNLQFDSTVLPPSAWTSGGTAVRCVPLSLTTKQFNPFIDQGQRVRCGWVYIYASATGTFLTDKDGNPVPAQLDIDIFNDDNFPDDPVTSTTLTIPYRADISNSALEQGSKKWYKLFLNTSGKFVQLRIKNSQAGARVKIHGLNFGFMPAGRLI